MMTELLAALHDLLSQAGLPVYASDAVPDGAALPCFTLESMPAVGRSALRLTVWCAGDAPHARRLALCDALLLLIPAGGLRLRLTDCAALLTRAVDAPIQCRREADCLGLSLPLTLFVHPLARKEAD